MENRFGTVIVMASLLLIFGWLSWGVWLFLVPYDQGFSWARGEVGDFVGGGLGGIAVFGVVYTLWLQIQQLKDQKRQSFKAATLQMYEVLKPEVENLSARIVSKALITGLIKPSEKDDSFSAMLKKYHDGDRTVFLRAMQKGDYSKVIQSDHGDPELTRAIDRFQAILEFLQEELNQAAAGPEQKFTDAMKQTEIYQTFLVCFDSSEKLMSLK
jgi:hypothetical protein